MVYPVPPTGVYQKHLEVHSQAAAFGQSVMQPSYNWVGVRDAVWCKAGA